MFLGIDIIIMVNNNLDVFYVFLIINECMVVSYKKK